MIILDERREAEESVNDDNPSQTTETKTTVRTLVMMVVLTLFLFSGCY